MGKGLKRSLAHANMQSAPIVKQVIPVRAKTVTVAGATGVGFGTVVLGGLPEANILFLGAVSYLQFTTADADVTATFDGDMGVGTVPTADADLGDAGDDNFIPSTALGAATAKVSPVVRGVSTDSESGIIIDNTAGSLEVNLNLLIDDASISADDVDFTVEGAVTLSYVVLGDD